MNEKYGHFMAKAIELAKKGRFKTCPNPVVGAVLVKDGNIVASGWHHAYGQPHAEIDCLNNAKINGISPAGATLVVTLEPCRHHGKTPPCTDAILNAGIATLVYGAKDPNPAASGGADILGQAGIEIIGPVLEQRCMDLIADFIIWQTTERPYIYLKMASTLDGRIATRSGHSRWISGEQAREEVHRLRAGIGLAGGAVLIGGGTFRADNPLLTARTTDHNPGENPLACILTSRLPRPGADFQLLVSRPDETVFFASPAASASTTAESLRKIGCRIYALGPDASGDPDFAAMLQIMRKELGCYYVLCEGGGKLALSLLEKCLADQFRLYLAPLILGDNEARPLFNGRNPLNLDEALKMRITDLRQFGEDVRITARPAGGC